MRKVISEIQTVQILQSVQKKVNKTITTCDYCKDKNKQVEYKCQFCKKDCCYRHLYITNRPRLCKHCYNVIPISTKLKMFGFNTSAICIVNLLIHHKFEIKPNNKYIDSISVNINDIKITIYKNGTISLLNKTTDNIKLINKLLL